VIEIDPIALLIIRRGEEITTRAEACRIFEDQLDCFIDHEDGPARLDYLAKNTDATVHPDGTFDDHNEFLFQLGQI
jgi:hypothetical protein